MFSRQETFGGLIAMLMVWAFTFLAAAFIGNIAIGYILGAFFGDVSAWLALPLILRAVIGAVLAGPSIPAAIVTFLVSLFVSTPFL